MKENFKIFLTIGVSVIIAFLGYFIGGYFGMFMSFVLYWAIFIIFAITIRNRNKE